MKLKVNLVEKVWKKWSFIISGAAAVVAGMEFLLPDLQAMLPERWYMFVFIAIMIARAVKQAADTIQDLKDDKQE